MGVFGHKFKWNPRSLEVAGPTIQNFPRGIGKVGSKAHRHVTVRQAVDGVEFKTAEAELKTKMLGRVGSRRHGERCSSRDGSRDGRRPKP